MFECVACGSGEVSIHMRLTCKTTRRHNVNQRSHEHVCVIFFPGRGSLFEWISHYTRVCTANCLKPNRPDGLAAARPEGRGGACEGAPAGLRNRGAYGGGSGPRRRRTARKKGQVRARARAHGRLQGRLGLEGRPCWQQARPGTMVPCGVWATAQTSHKSMKRTI